MGFTWFHYHLGHSQWSFDCFYISCIWMSLWIRGWIDSFNLGCSWTLDVYTKMVMTFPVKILGKHDKPWIKNIYRLLFAMQVHIMMLMPIPLFTLINFVCVHKMLDSSDASAPLELTVTAELEIFRILTGTQGTFPQRKLYWVQKRPGNRKQQFRIASRVSCLSLVVQQRKKLLLAKVNNLTHCLQVSMNHQPVDLGKVKVFLKWSFRDYLSLIFLNMKIGCFRLQIQASKK